MSTTESIIEKFGSASRLAEAVEVSRQVVSYWRRAGTIPARRHQDILDAARARGIDLTPNDFFASQPDPRSNRSA